MRLHENWKDELRNFSTERRISAIIRRFSQSQSLEMPSEGEKEINFESDGSQEF